MNESDRLFEEVLRAPPPLSREDEATAAIIKGMLTAAELLEQDDENTEP